MKIRIKDSVEGRFMKKLLLTCILIVGIIFITGCIGEEKTNTGTLTSSQISQESDTQAPDLIIKPSDVPGRTLTEYFFIGFPKSTIYSCEYRSLLSTESGEVKYKDVLPLGTRNVGQLSSWSDESGRSIVVVLRKYDSNSGFKDEKVERSNRFAVDIDDFKQNTQAYKDVGRDIGDANIGDCSIYKCLPIYPDRPDYQPDVKNTFLTFIYGNYLVNVIVVDEKDKSVNEAIRIAKIIESELD